MVKKGQTKIQQTAFLLIAITLFFVLAGLLFLGFYLSGIKDDANALKEKQTRLLVSKLADSPEFSCGESFGSKLRDCVDSDKVMMLMKEREKYKNFWGVENIEIIKIYPEMAGEVECTLGNYPDCNVFKVLNEENTGIYDSNFVSLCRKESEGGKSYNKCELGLLMVSYEKE